MNTERLIETGRELQQVKDWLKLFDAGSVNYVCIAKIVNLSKADIAILLGVTKSSVRFDDKIPEVVAACLHELGLTANMVGHYFEGNESKVRFWFRSPIPMLGNTTPRDMVRVGRHQRLRDFVLDAYEAESLSNGPTKI